MGQRHSHIRKTLIDLIFGHRPVEIFFKLVTTNQSNLLIISSGRTPLVKLILIKIIQYTSIITVTALNEIASVGMENLYGSGLPTTLPSATCENGNLHE